MPWQFIDSSNNSRSNLTQVKRHVMHEYMRQKRQDDGTQETGEKNSKPRQRSKRSTTKSGQKTKKKRADSTKCGQLAQGSCSDIPVQGQKPDLPLSQGIDCTPALRCQLVSVFLEAYLPSVTNPYQRLGGDFTGALPFKLGGSPMLDYAITALCAVYVGSSWQDRMLYREGVESYARAVQCLRGCIKRSTTTQDMLYVTAALQTYEVVQPSQHGMAGWRAHVQGCRALLRHGRDGSGSALNDDELYRHMQMVMIAEAVVHRKSAYVPNPSWRPRTPSLFDRALDMLVNCTSLMEDVRHLEQDRGRDKRAAGHHLLQKCVCIEGQLNTQYSALRSRLDFPNLWNTEEFEGYKSTESDDLFFDDAFCFESFPVAQVYSLHWATQLLTYMAIERLCCVMDESVVPGQPSAFLFTRSYKDIIDLASFSAGMICRSVKYCFSPGMNAFGVQVLFVRLWLANQFYHGRRGFEKEYAWCQRIIRKITDAGFQGAPDFMNIHWPPLPSQTHYDKIDT